MTRSETINELFAAMAKAQAEMTGAKKDSTNPHFRSAYADLASVRDACFPALNKHGLGVLQFPRLVSAGDGWMVEVETVLTHSSGQFISDVIAVPVSKPDAQGVGSATTYARRYALGAIAGVAPEDDDGNAAVGTSNGNGHSDALPNGAMETATVRVEKVTMKPTANGKTTQYTVHANDGRTYTTIKKADAETAKLACEAGQSVEMAYVPTRWGRDIKSIAEVEVPEPAI